MLAALLCPENPTLTNLICVNGGQHRDWTADYRLYSHERIDETHLFQSALDQLLEHLPEQAPLLVALDDTLVRKTGTHIHGVAWRRDPLGPAFQTNLVRGQRYLQLSAAWPLKNGSARMIPVAFRHCPSAPKAPKNADAAQLAQHRETLRQHNLNTHAIDEMKRLRDTLPPAQKLHFAGDGSYTNGKILKNLPPDTTYIGRIRKDAKLHHPPPEPATTTPNPKGGRPQRYGAPAPTPDQLRADPTVEWTEIQAHAAGKTHTFKIKTLDRVLWRKTGTRQIVRILVIAPLGYRLRKGGKLLYRQPAYILCTDPHLPTGQLLQHYLWRWGIEVNFREEKTLLGTGKSQVRTPASNTHLPATLVAAYSLLWIAALRLHHREALPPSLTPPKWRAKKDPTPDTLPSTGDLLRSLRYETWAKSIRPSSFHHFATPPPPDTKSQKPSPNLPATLLHAA